MSPSASSPPTSSSPPDRDDGNSNSSNGVKKEPKKTSSSYIHSSNNESKGGNAPSTSTNPFTSWWNSWFDDDGNSDNIGRDVRNEIRSKLNEYDEWKSEQEKQRKELERRMMMSTSNRRHPFFAAREDIRQHPFFVDDSIDRGATSNNEINDLYSEMQSMFEAMGGGASVFPPSSKPRNSNDMEEFFSAFDLESIMGDGNRNHHRNNNGASTTMFTSTSSFSSSSLNGTSSSYKMQQDSRNGTRIDIQSPTAANIEVEVLKENPCTIQWRNNTTMIKKNQQQQDHNMFRHRGFGIDHRNDDDNNASAVMDGSGERNDNGGNLNRIIEMGYAIDCSKLSATISESENIVTIRAPIILHRQPTKDRNISSSGEKANPRSIPIVPK